MEKATCECTAAGLRSMLDVRFAPCRVHARRRSCTKICMFTLRIRVHTRLSLGVAPACTGAQLLSPLLQMAAMCAFSFGLGAGISWLVQRKFFKHALATTPGRQEPGSVKYIHPPHPAWEPGQPQPHPFSADDRVEIDPSEIDKAYLYSLMISAVTPRPIGFVSSMGRDGSHNLSPYSYFNMVGLPLSRSFCL